MTDKVLLPLIVALTAMLGQQQPSPFGTRIDTESSPQPNTEQKPGERKVLYAPGQPLLSLLRESDRLLVVEDITPPPLRVLPDPASGTTLAEWKTQFADLVALIDIDKKTTSLSPEKDWLTTTLAASVIEVLNQRPSLNVSAGAQFTFTQRGGELKVGDKTVRARWRFGQQYETNRRYLAFIVFDQAGAWYVSDAYEIAGQELKSQRTGPHREKDEIERADDLESTLLQIRRAATRRPPGL